MICPSLIAAALTRMADATLRNSIHRSSQEIIYMAMHPRYVENDQDLSRRRDRKGRRCERWFYYSPLRSHCAGRQRKVRPFRLPGADCYLVAAHTLVADRLRKSDGRKARRGRC